MSLKSLSKHLLHCTALFSIISMYIILEERHTQTELDYGTVLNLLLLIPQYFVLLTLPVGLLMFLGLVCFNTFPDEVTIKDPTRSTPFICVRTVTRGVYPELVVENVHRNVKTCFESGLQNFVMEVVTDKSVGLPPYPRFREIVVPPNYKTKNGTLFKARALQYCLEEGNNTLLDEDWVVHLDEETIMTPDSVRGIINFVNEGRHQLGQGMITYANERVVNWITTLADSTRVAEDLGLLKFQLRALHRLLLSWKGSFLVIKAEVERKITFDHGPRGSVTEDINFGLLAAAQGYSFDFIEGEMWEKSPFSLQDFIKQRSRWCQGGILVATNKKVPYKAKLLFCYSTWLSLALPVIAPIIILTLFFPMPCGPVIRILRSFLLGLFTYTFVFGILRSFSLARLGFFKYVTCIVFSFLVLPSFKFVLDTIAVTKSIFTKKIDFYIVKKGSLAVSNGFCAV